MKNRDDSKLDLDPIALHRENNHRLEQNDIIIPAYPGSGHALLGNIFLELGLNYSDPYTERFGDNGKSTPIDERSDYRKRLAATARRDNKSIIYGLPRFVKTHLYPRDFDKILNEIILLVRDPRDAMYSYYNWRLSFSEEGEKGTFLDFLNREGHNNYRPVQDWVQFHLDWIAQEKQANHFHIVHFEDLKKKPKETLGLIVATYAPHIDDDNLLRAIEESKFEVMKTHELQASRNTGSNRIMRRGMVGEWRTWFTPTFKTALSDSTLQELATTLGYSDWPNEDSL